MYFTLHGDFRTSLTDEAPQGVSWKQIVTFRDPISAGDKTLIVAAAFAQRPFQLPRVGSRFQTAVLKSNLQKAVRRGKVEAAVATAFQMACQGPEDLTELIRRLPIILVEDTLLNSKIMGRWTWWMLAIGKGWILSDTEWRRLLADLAFVASCKSSPFREADLKFGQESVLECQQQILGVGEEGKRIGLFGLWIRSQWGGMTGDMNMLRGLVLDWLARPHEDWIRGGVLSGPPNALLPTFPIFDPVSHALPEAVDFHCCPGMLKDFAQSSAGKAGEAELKQAIWICRSSTNCRTFFVGDKKESSENAEALAKLLEGCNFDHWVRKGWKPLAPPKTTQGSMIAFLKPVGA
jgi:hypothetical protein